LFQHTGKEQLPFEEKASQELKEAHYSIYGQGHSLKLMARYRVNKDGTFTFVKLIKHKEAANLEILT
jgi:hypothetical protein